MMNSTPGSLLIKTYEFLVWRFIIGTASVIPLVWSFDYGMQRLRDFFGIYMFITDMLYGYIGLTIGVIYIMGVQKILIHLIGYAHVDAMTGVLWKGEYRVSIINSLKTLFSRAGSIAILFAMDKILVKSTSVVSKWLVEKSESLPQFFRRGLVVSILSGTIKQIIYNIPEAIMSYTFRHPDITIWEGIAKGLGNYIRAWPTILKRTLINLVYLRIFSFVIKFVVLVTLLPVLWGQGVFTFVKLYLLYKIVAALFKLTLLEPYVVASMLVGFKEAPDSEEDSSLVERFSGLFKTLDSAIRSKWKSKTELEGSITEILNDNLNVDFSSFGLKTLGLGGKKDEHS